MGGRRASRARGSGAVRGPKLAALLLALGWPSPGAAQSGAPGPAEVGAPVETRSARADAMRTPSFALGVGYYDVGGPFPAALLGVAFRSSPWLGPLASWVHGLATTDGSVGGFAGILWDIPVGSRLVLTPATGVGGWRRGDGKPLGSALEFQSTAELSWRLGSEDRLAIALAHISNAGFGRTNPGVNTLSLRYLARVGG